MKEITDLQIGTWNVRSLFRTGALTTSLPCLERYKMDITAIQEVRWTSSGSSKSQGMTIFYSGGDKHERGVGFIIKENLLPQITNFKPINDRLCYIELKCKWYNLILINCYSPTEDKNGRIKIEFYDPFTS